MNLGGVGISGGQQLEIKEETGLMKIYFGKLGMEIRLNFSMIDRKMYP